MLLRRLATRIGELGENAMVLDVTISDEVTDLGSWFRAAVYYAADGWAEP